jgi:hypothetical protein
MSRDKSYDKARHGTACKKNKDIHIHTPLSLATHSAPTRTQSDAYGHTLSPNICHCLIKNKIKYNKYLRTERVLRNKLSLDRSEDCTSKTGSLDLAEDVRGRVQASPVVAIRATWNCGA